MKRRDAYVLAAIGITAIATIYLMAFYANKPNEKKNGFSRQFILNAITEVRNIELNEKPESIIGESKDHIYLIGEVPDKIIAVNYQLKSKEIITIPILSEEEHTKTIPIVDFPDVYIFTQNSKLVIKYNLVSKQIMKNNLNEMFSKGLPILNNSFILRTMDSTKSDQVFKKIVIGNDTHSKVANDILEKVGDGGFSTDGMLYYDKHSKNLCYTFFYRNGFIAMDSDLNLLYRARTIDTITIPQLYGKKIVSKSKVSFTYSGTPTFINLRGSVNNSRLFLRSALKADNEDATRFLQNSVLDVYDTKNGNYRGSFYLPTYGNKKAAEFKVLDGLLVAIYDKTILVYKLKADI